MAVDSLTIDYCGITLECVTLREVTVGVMKDEIEGFRNKIKVEKIFGYFLRFFKFLNFLSGAKSIKNWTKIIFRVISGSKHHKN